MIQKMSNKVRIKDIAARAGVSIGTVDRVLHQRGDVNEETRRKILEIVEDMGYKPNIIAKTLSSKKTMRIAIVIPDSSDNNPYWEIPIQGIRKAAEELIRYNTELMYEFFDASEEASFRNALLKVCSRELDGIVMNPVFRKTTEEFLEKLNETATPYVFIDVNIKGVGKLGYFGQDAEQSGRVAASLMESGNPDLSRVLIIKQTSRKVFSQHIESRVKGFLGYFREKQTGRKMIEAIIIEIDLLEKEEPEKTLAETIAMYPEVKAVFIPNSRVFLFADFIEKRNLEGYFVIGYDIIEKNNLQLEKGNISYLVCQKAEIQAYNAIMALFNHLIANKAINKTNYSPIDIINKENLEYYKKN